MKEEAEEAAGRRSAGRREEFEEEWFSLGADQGEGGCLQCQRVRACCGR